MTELVFDPASFDDTSPNKIVSRTVARLAAKGFEATQITRVTGKKDGFNWGRSSHATSYTLVWHVYFFHEMDEHAICIVEGWTDYTRRNPYDRVPKNDGVHSARVQMNVETMKLLGVPIPKAD